MSIPFNLPNVPVTFSHHPCTGAGPHAGHEVRLFSDARDRHLCRACFDREVTWRAARNRDLADGAYETPSWESLPISIHARPST